MTASTDQMPIGPAPRDTGPKLLQMTFFDPRGLRLVALLGQAPNSVDTLLLNRDHSIHQARGIGQTVGAGEHLEAAAPVGRLGIAQPAQAFSIVPKRGDVFEGVGDIMATRRRTSMVPVDDPDRSVAAPDDVPGAEVPMADHVITNHPRGRGRPTGRCGRTVFGDSIVVLAQQMGEGDQPTVIDDLSPAIRSRFPADPGQNLTTLLIEAENTRRPVIADGLKVTKQPVNRRGPRPHRAVHRIADPFDPA